MKIKKKSHKFLKEPKLLKNKFILTISYKFKNSINFTGNNYGN